MILPVHEELSDSEVYRLCIAARAGCPASRERLILNNARLVWKIANDFTGWPVPTEDLAGAGIIALHRAIDSYSDKGSWSAFAGVCVRNAILKYLKHESRHRCEECSEDIDSDSAVPGHDQDITDSDLRRAALEAVDRLPVNQAAVVKHYFGLNGAARLNFNAIGSRYNVSRESIRNWLNHGLSRLRHDLELSA